MKKIACLMLCCLMLTGCATRLLEEPLMVISLSIDKKDNGDIELAVKVPSSASPETGPAQGGNNSSSNQEEGQGYITTTVIGKDWNSCLVLLNASIPRHLDFSQVREVVMGQKTAEGPDCFELLYAAYNLPNMRLAAVPVISKGSAKEFISKQKAYIGTRLSHYIDALFDNFSGQGFIPNISLGECVHELGFGYNDPLLVYGAINKFDEKEAHQHDQPLEDEAGTLTRINVNELEYVGAALTDGRGVCGVITGHEMKLISLLQGNYQRMTLAVGERYCVLYTRLPAKLSVDISTSPITLTIQLFIVAEYLPEDELTSEAIMQVVTQNYLDLMEKLQGYRSDAVGFGNVAIRNFMTIDQWSAFNWRDQYSEAQIKIDTIIQMKEN